jgi:hypothetical protein
MLVKDLPLYTFPTTVRPGRVETGGITEGPVWTVELDDPVDPEVAPVLDITSESSMIPKLTSPARLNRGLRAHNL